MKITTKQPQVFVEAGNVWGTINGTLSDQVDLQEALDGKIDENAAITGETKTKITYDSKGLVTNGADATTDDISEVADKRYVTDAQIVILNDTSGINTGDQDLSGYVPYTGATADLDLGANNLKMPSGEILDASDLTSIHINNRATYDTNNTLSLSWETRVAYYGTGYLSINYQNGTLYGDYPSSLPTVDYGNNFYLRDSLNILSLRWDARTIINSYNSVLLGWYDEALVMGGSQYASNGAIWADATQKAFGIYHAGVSQTIQSALFTQTATGTRANSTAEGNISSTGVGTLSLPANFFVSGKTLRVSGRGFHSSTASPTLNLKVKLGSTVISTTGAHTHHNATNGYFEFDTFITCRTTGASGTVFAQGKMFDATDIVTMGSTATVTVNTTTTQAITVTAQWSVASASNTISLTNLIVEVIN